MNRIVFDLEWNMGYEPYVFSYEGFPIALRGEVIQIGAVRINHEGQVLEEFSALLTPRIFRRLHYQIAKVTGLTQKDLLGGEGMASGLKRFIDWCGPDAALLTWGPDDIGVLKQNLHLNGLSTAWPAAFYDLQRLYTAQYPRGEGEGMSLEAVIERLGLPQDSTFHDALADAQYTAAICTKLNLEAGIAQYPDTDAFLREALAPTSPQHPLEGWERFGPSADKETWNSPATVPTPLCPVCKQPLVEDAHGIWIKRGNHGRTMLCRCNAHGSWMARWKRMQQDGLHWEFARALEKPEEAVAAQWTKRKAAQLAAIRRRKEMEEAAKSEHPHLI